MDSSERLDDLALLFLPDILHPDPPGPHHARVPDTDINADWGWAQLQPPPVMTKLMLPLPGAVAEEVLANFMTHNHYAGFIPVEATGLNTNQRPHVPGHLQTYPPVLMPPQFGTYGGVPPVATPPPGSLLAAALTPMNNYPHPPPQQREQLRRKQRRKEPVKREIEFDYRAHHLRRLLDLKPQPHAQLLNFTIVDKDNNPVNVTFGGFLNGRFLTNDIDNSNFLASVPNQATGEGPVPPAVISCYRRNYIQISMNMQILGIKFPLPLLRVQTLDFGYTITRVIKYFKLEVLAGTKMPRTSKSDVSIKIRDLYKETEKEKRAQVTTLSDDTIVPSQILNLEHIILLNDDQPVDNGIIDKFFVIKQCQFKSATPNNGHLNFQNYYHLIVKLSAVVADLYHDDYYEEDPGMAGATGAGSTGGGETNEILLCELRLEPIIVRGRNPSFYADRDDMLIRGRLLYSKQSYKLAISGGAEPGDETSQFERGISADPAPQNNNDIDQLDDSEARLPQTTTTTNQREQSLELLAPDVLGPGQDNQDLLTLLRYKYFPILNVYYLPPINVVYFPHLHRSKGELVPSDSSDPPRERRKNLNLYFS